MKAAVLVRLFALIVIAALAVSLGILLGVWLVEWWPSLAGSTLFLIAGFLLSLLAAAAFVAALPGAIRFSRCGLKHLGPLIRDAGPALSLLLLAAIALKIGLASQPPVTIKVPVPAECPPAPETPPMTDLDPVPDREEVSTDLVFDYNRGQSYSPQHEEQMDRYLTDMFADYDEIEITQIVAHTDPIGSEQRNRDLAQQRADYIRRAIERVAQAKKLASRFKTAKLPAEIVVAKGPSAGDHIFWKACFDKFYLSQPADRPLENLAPELAGNRPACSTSTVDNGKDGNFPACRRILPGDASRSTIGAFAKRQENFRELTACLAPMRHVVVSFNRARLPPEAKCPKLSAAPVAVKADTSIASPKK